MHEVILKTWRDRRGMVHALVCRGGYHWSRGFGNRGDILIEQFLGSCPGESCRRYKLADVRN